MLFRWDSGYADEAVYEINARASVNPQVKTVADVTNSRVRRKRERVRDRESWKGVIT